MSRITLRDLALSLGNLAHSKATHVDAGTANHNGMAQAVLPIDGSGAPDGSPGGLPSEASASVDPSLEADTEKVCASVAFATAKDYRARYGMQLNELQVQAAACSAVTKAQKLGGDNSLVFYMNLPNCVKDGFSRGCQAEADQAVGQEAPRETGSASTATGGSVSRDFAARGIQQKDY